MYAIRSYYAHLRNHRKLLITDGMTAFCGGMNIGKKYMGPKRERHQWRDIGVVIRGPAVRDLQVVFLDDWAFATDETGPAGHLFPSLPRITSYNVCYTKLLRPARQRACRRHA